MGSISSVPRVFVTLITPRLLEAMQKKYSTLSEVERTYVDAGPSPLRRTLRMTQLGLFQLGVELLGFDYGELTLTSDQTGCPRIISRNDTKESVEYPHISISHSDNALAVAISPFRIGVDIEELRTLPKSPITLLFSPQELTEITDDVSFTRAWVRKEAYAKWLGIGLSDALADGTYETETHTMHVTYDESLFYLGLAGTHCQSALINQVTFATD